VGPDWDLSSGSQAEASSTSDSGDDPIISDGSHGSKYAAGTDSASTISSDEGEDGDPSASLALCKAAGGVQWHIPSGYKEARPQQSRIASSSCKGTIRLLVISVAIFAGSFSSIISAGLVR